MVAPKNTIVDQDELVLRAKLIAQLLDAIDDISVAAEQIRQGNYWSGYRTTSRADLMLCEVALGLHDAEMASENRP